MTDHPSASQMMGYLLVRGGVHQVAYAKALEQLTGASVPNPIRPMGKRSSSSTGRRRRAAARASGRAGDRPGFHPGEIGELAAKLMARTR